MGRLSIAAGAVLWSLVASPSTARGAPATGSLEAVKVGRTPGLASVQAFSAAFADLAASVGPATVHITADKTPPVSKGLEQLIRDYALPTAPGQGRDLGSTSGSGVVVRPDGLVLTNHHVVGGATGLIVTLSDKRAFPARLVGSDPRTDVALLQIEGEGPFAWAAVGDSDAVRVGEWVMALGHPFDFQFSVTAGVVSARGRRNLARDEIQDYIQTDAAVNPGSSGGPLFNLDGEIIGINTAIYNPGNTAQNAGIAFAIPANMAWRIAQELLDSGRVARASIGVETQDRPATEGNPRPGAEVTRIVPAGPAERAGVRRGDVIIAVNGEPIAGSEDLRGVVLAAGAGQRLRLRVERSDTRVEVELEAEDGRDVDAPPGDVPADGITWGGMVLAPPTEDRAVRFGVALPTEPSLGGLLVLGVVPASPASAAGVRPGDLVFEVQREAVSDVDALLRAVADRRSATLTLWRSGGRAVAVLGGLERQPSE